MKHKFKRHSFVRGISAAVVAMSTPSAFAVPTADAPNLTVNITNTLENIQQGLRQVQQVQTQLAAYENMVRNSLAPVTSIWTQTQQTMNALRSTIDTVTYYKNAAGSIDNYIARFKSLADYRSSPCYTGSCTPEQWLALAQNKMVGLEALKKTADAAIRTVDQQQQTLVADADQLHQLQLSANSAGGQMEALGYSNQLASHTVNQLLQIRGVLVNQQNLMATQAQIQLDKSGSDAAASERFREVLPVSPIISSTSAGK